MATVSYRLEDLKKAIVGIGYVGENDHMHVLIDCKEVFDEYPDAVPTMAIVPPVGEGYPKAVTRDGDVVEWLVKDSDVTVEGDGEFQLTFTEGEVIKKSVNGRFRVKRSISGSGEAPSGVQDWLTDANEKLAAVEEATQEAEAAANHQPYIGIDGYWYTWNGEEFVKNVKAQGEKGDPGDPGSPGDPTQLIDDTAGEGQTEKTWSADKLDEEFGSVLSAIQGVEDELKTVTETSEEIENITFTTGYAIMANPNESRYGNRAEANVNVNYCDYVNVEKYKKIDITMPKYQNQTDYGIVFYSSNSSSTPVAGYTINSGAASLYIETRTFDIPEGAKYFRSTFRVGYDFECIGYFDEEVHAIAKIEADVGNLNQLETAEKNDIVSAINEVNHKASAIIDVEENVLVAFDAGYILIANSQDGNYGKRYSTGNKYLCSKYVNIEKYNKIEITMPKYQNPTDAGIVFYTDDVSGNVPQSCVIGYVINSGASSMTSETRIFDKPAGAKYFRTTYRTDLDEFSCVGHYEVDTGGLGDVYEKAIENEAKINTIENENTGMNIAVKVTDFDDGVMTDDQIISAALAFASNFDKKTIIFDTRTWTISQAILLEANTTVIIDGVKIKQADETFDNVFRGKNFVVDHDYPNQFAASVSDTENIRIIGMNGAAVEGPDVNATIYNPYLQETVTMVGDEYGWRAFQIYFCNCDGIEISGLKITKTRNWAISFEFCKNGHIHDLVFNTVGVKNGDGVDLRIGCHHFNIHDIYGITKDDTVACTCLYPAYNNSSYPSQTSDSMFPCVASRTGQSLENVDQRTLDIHDVIISNIFTGGDEHGVICLCNNGLRVYNVGINNVKEKETSIRESVVYIYNGYGSSWHQGSYTAGDLNHISVGDVEANGATYALKCSCTVADVFLNKLVQKVSGRNAYSISNMSGITITNTDQQ